MNFRDCFGGNAGTDVAQPLWASITSPLALQLIRFLLNNTPRPAELFDWLLNSRQTFVFFYLHISHRFGTVGCAGIRCPTIPSHQFHHYRNVFDQTVYWLVSAQKGVPHSRRMMHTFLLCHSIRTTENPIIERGWSMVTYERRPCFALPTRSVQSLPTSCRHFCCDLAISGTSPMEDLTDL